MTLTEPAPVVTPTTHRLLAAAAADLAEHDRRNGPLPT